MNTTKIRQEDMVLNYLKAGGVLTALDALELFGTMKLATKISNIKKEYPGIDIQSEPVINLKNNKRYFKYWIPREYKTQAVML